MQNAPLCFYPDQYWHDIPTATLFHLAKGCVKWINFAQLLFLDLSVLQGWVANDEPTPKKICEGGADQRWTLKDSLYHNDFCNYVKFVDC